MFRSCVNLQDFGIKSILDHDIKVKFVKGHLWQVFVSLVWGRIRRCLLVLDPL